MANIMSNTCHVEPRGHPLISVSIKRELIGTVLITPPEHNPVSVSPCKMDIGVVVLIALNP